MVAVHLCDSGAIGKGNNFDSKLRNAGKYSKFKIKRERQCFSDSIEFSYIYIDFAIIEVKEHLLSCRKIEKN